jgi:CHAT domain-containing protein/Tfp pilus assembly protein PilF
MIDGLRRFRNIFVSAAICCFALVTAQPAFAQSSRDDDTRRAFQALIEKADAGDFESLEQLVYVLHTLGRYSDAVPYATRGVEIAKRRFSDRDKRYAQSLNNLASLYKELGQYREAEKLTRDSLASYERALGPNSEQSGMLYNNLAGILDRAGRPREAEEAYTKSLEILTKINGRNDPVVASIINNISEFYRGQGAIRRALELSEESLKIFKGLKGEHRRELGTISNNVASLYRELGRYDGAEAIYKRSLAYLTDLGATDGPEFARSLNNIGILYRDRGRFDEAEASMRRSLAIREAVYGRENPEVASGLHDLAGLLSDLGRYAEAEELINRSLAIRLKVLGPSHPEVANSLNSLVLIYRNTGRQGEIDKRLGAMLESAKHTLPPGHPNLAALMMSQALILSDLGRFDEADKIENDSLEMLKAVYGEFNPAVSQDLNNLALTKNSRGQFAEAERLLQESIQIVERLYGPRSIQMAGELNNLSALLVGQGREAEARPLMLRNIDILRQVVGEDHPAFAAGLSNLAVIEEAVGNVQEALRQAERSLAIKKRLIGEEHPDVALSLTNLASLLAETGQTGRAIEDYEQARSIYEKVFGPDNYFVAETFARQGQLLSYLGRLDEAAPLLKRGAEIAEKTYGPDHPTTAERKAAIALNAFRQTNLTDASQEIDQATNILEKRNKVGPDRSLLSSTQETADLKKQSDIFRLYVVIANRKETNDGLLNTAFEKAQRALKTDADAALSQMAARLAAGSDDLARLLRERQDLLLARDAANKRLVADLSAPHVRAGNGGAEVERNIIAGYNEKLGVIAEKARSEFHRFTTDISSEPISIRETQDLLQDDEALIQFMDVPKQLTGKTFIWLVTKRDARWLSVDIGTEALVERVQTLRCGLDPQNWIEVSDEAGISESETRRRKIQRALLARCNQLVGTNTWRGSLLAPFNLLVAHELYETLLSPVADLIAEKRLLIVPSGALSSLPFGVLVTENPKVAFPPNDTGYRDVAWLIRRHAITTLPSVSALSALRGSARPSRADQPFIGFGNPLLDGNADKPEEQERAQLAVKWQHCSDIQSRPQILTNDDTNVFGLGRALFRGPRANVIAIQHQPPLPESATELCEVARASGVEDGNLDFSVRLGSSATETAIRAMNARGELEHFSVVQFATHGVTAGQWQGLAEPGLILTPPRNTTSGEDDDGYLAASEIAELKLDADWVVLSACNTAAGKGDNSEALSGLARAFFYAGARALLVSHWTVKTNAAVRLTTRAFQEMKADPKIGRDEAMRRSMLALLGDSTWPEAGHPLIWAPFFLVGEGARK